MVLIRESRDQMIDLKKLRATTKDTRPIQLVDLLPIQIQIKAEPRNGQPIASKAKRWVIHSYQDRWDNKGKQIISNSSVFQKEIIRQDVSNNKLSQDSNKIFNIQLLNTINRCREICLCLRTKLLIIQPIKCSQDLVESTNSSNRDSILMSHKDIRQTKGQTHLSNHLIILDFLQDKLELLSRVFQ